VKEPPATEFVDVKQHLEQQVFRHRSDDVSNVLGHTATQRAADQQAFTDMARKAGIELKPISKTLFDGLVDGELKQLRGEVDEDALDSQAVKDATETRQQLSSRYGEEGEKLLARTNAWIKTTQPALHKILGTHGLGSRPDVVLELVDHVRRLGWKPKP
jgi:hypothetical protein